MKSVHEKTEILVEQVCSLDFRTQQDVDRARVAIRRALKEQDRDTRHACAEAVIAITGETGDDLIDAGIAHSACMNTTKAI